MAIVINSSSISDDSFLKDKTCHICGDRLGLQNYISYRLGADEPWSLVTTICCDCLELMHESQSSRVKIFVEQMSNLNECSKMLKNLLRGEYGVPVNLHDIIIFPSVDDRVILNHLDPEFGRKNEVFELRVGQNSESRNPHLSNAPSTREEVRRTLLKIIECISEKLKDYELTEDRFRETQVDEIRCLVNSLQRRIEGVVAR